MLCFNVTHGLGCRVCQLRSHFEGKCSSGHPSTDIDSICWDPRTCRVAEGVRCKQ